ncbi:MAG: hypothetical protein LBU70_06200 [Chitinispirillales bacterium]|jgi:hypothetical protein|nr:hypothetical protein [Chitinispirillales bacterium]
MQLQEVVDRSQFEEYYRSNNLNTDSEKINRLIRTMKIRAMRCDDQETPEELLAGLEETALFGCWKASW